MVKLSKDSTDSLKELKNTNTICFFCSFHALKTRPTIIGTERYKKVSHCRHSHSKQADYYLEKPYLCCAIRPLIYKESDFLKDMLNNFGQEAVLIWKDAKTRIELGENVFKREKGTPDLSEKDWKNFLRIVEFEKQEMVKSGEI